MEPVSVLSRDPIGRGGILQHFSTQQECIHSTSPIQSSCYCSIINTMHLYFITKPLCISTQTHMLHAEQAEYKTWVGFIK